MADKKDNLTVITGLHFSKAMLKMINGITFMYDPSWNPDDYAFPTLPACFFHVKKMNEIMSSEISQKPMLFYNEQSNDIKNSTAGSVLNVVADNIIIKPKTYRLEVLIPYENLTLLSSMVEHTLGTVPTVMTTQLSGEAEKSDWTSYVSPWLSMSQTYMKLIFDILKQLSNVNFSISDNWLSGVMGTVDYNKKSLEAMWRSRKILKLKTHDNWTYKYVAITDLDITKEGTDDGVYEATLTVQEVPVMTIDKARTLDRAEFKGLSSITGKAVIKTLDGAGNLFGSKWS